MADPLDPEASVEVSPLSVQQKVAPVVIELVAGLRKDGILSLVRLLAPVCYVCYEYDDKN